MKRQVDEIQKEVTRLGRYREFSERYSVFEDHLRSVQSNLTLAEQTIGESKQAQDRLHNDVSMLKNELQEAKNKIMRLEGLLGDNAEEYERLSTLWMPYAVVCN